MAVCLLLVVLAVATQAAGPLPLVVNTWPFKVATQAAWEVLQHSSPLDAVEAVRPACAYSLPADPRFLS